ncbi:MAG TPA: uroporphyrinogen decarboxylase family protein [bacterium]|nr:uroporphyrinogen decarboxylase family protein [bacterium]
MNVAEIPGYEVLNQDHIKIARELVEEARAHDGMIPMDLEKFWADNHLANSNPFGAEIPQVAFGATLTSECVFDELGVPEDVWRYHNDADWRLELNKAYNVKSEAIVGRRLVSENPPGDPTKHYPGVKGLHDVFEARNEWHNGSWWLMQSAHDEDELKALLDRVEQCDIRSFILPPNWEEEKKRLMAMDIRPHLYRGQRGPVTFAASVYGAENLLFLILDNPELAVRFRDAILKTMLEIARVRDEEAGYTPETAPHGFSFCDDNCCLLNPEMYELFGYPIIKGIFERYCPDPGDSRFQHSDSAMGHLLPLMARLGMNRVNFGPTVMVNEIRKHLPNAIIYGQLAPFTYSRNEEERMVLEFFRDFEMSRQSRGLVFTTAGSINNGTRLTSMRLLMATIQRYGRF